MRLPVLLALAALILAPASAAQSPEDEVRAAIVRLFDGMRAGDSTVVRTAFLPGADLHTTAVRPDGTPVIVEGSLDEFVHAVGQPHDEVWDERIGEIQVNVDGPLATAWMPYAFYAGERFSHCGVNAFQLHRTPEGWKILQITDTRRRAQCVGPEGAPR